MSCTREVPSTSVTKCFHLLLSKRKYYNNISIGQTTYLLHRTENTTEKKQTTNTKEWWESCIQNNETEVSVRPFISRGDLYMLNFFFEKLMQAGNSTKMSWIGHFRVPLCLCLKASLSAKPFLWKWLICMKIKLLAELISYEWFRT